MCDSEKSKTLLTPFNISATDAFFMLQIHKNPTELFFKTCRKINCELVNVKFGDLIHVSGYIIFGLSPAFF